MSHAPQHDPNDDDRISTYLAWSQFVVTAVVLGAIGTLAYMAGFTSGKGGHAPADGAGAPVVAASADLGTLMTETPELVGQGKSLYAVNCVACHGAEGAGDGAAAVALNPKPRNFTSDQGWKYGSGVARIARTLTEGSPGTAMTAYQALPMPERIALAHYVRSLHPNAEDDKQADLDWLGLGTPGAGAGGAAAAAAPVAGPTIPIEKALALLTEPAHAAGTITAPAAEDTGEGARLYAARCASCHGGGGQGGIRVRMLGSSPYAYVVTESLARSRGDWAVNPASFDRHVAQGLSGAMMPGNGDLSRASLRELYSYTQTLRARQEAAGRGRSS
ncbi:MAG: c-type cytochrome [Candidatus Eisenbacteria bacterium]